MPLVTRTPTLRRPSQGGIPTVAAERLAGLRGNREQDLYVALDKVMKGKVNCTGEVTLTAAATTTTFNDPLITAASAVFWSPITANAGALPIVHCVPGNGSVVFHHASDAATDRTFRIAVFG